MSKNESLGLDRILAENYGYLENWLYTLMSILPPTLRKIFYKLLFSDFGKFNYIGENCYFRYPWKISIGSNVEIGMGARIFPSFKIKEAVIVIEDDVTIAPGLVIFGAGHPISEKRMKHIADSVFIRKNAYIGGNVLIRYGVEIGEGAVVAAGSVVVKDVKANTTVGGVPARKITS